jgi:hypothetical protein
VTDWAGFDVDVEELRRVFELLATHLASVAGPTITVKEDCYWSIERSMRLNLHTEPSKFSIGMLTDNWSTLREMDESNTFSYGFVWLAEILRELGETTAR